MASIIIMPRLGLNEDELENVLGEWFVKEGDTVKKGDELFSIETDKSSMSIYAEEEGTVLKTFWKEYDLVPVMAPVLILGTPGEDVSGITADTKAEAVQAPAEEAAPAAAAPVKEATPAKEAAEVRTASAPVSPRARRLAEANGLDASLLTPSGAEGRVIESDVIEALKKGAVPVKAEEAIKEAAPVKEDAPVHEAAPAAPAASAASDKSREPVHIPLTPMRKAIARNMYNALRNMAQTSDSVEIDVTELMALAKRLTARKDELGVKIGINDLLSYASVRMLKKHPYANAMYTDREIIEYPYVNVGSAVDTPYGLTSPVLYDADRMTLVEFASALHELIGRARDRKLTPKDQSNATFTLTNMGVFPCDNFNPILPEGTSLIVGFGRCVEKPAVWNGEICIRLRMVLSVTYDHRCFDGGQIGRIMKTLKDYMENPELFLVQ